jgi:hypothetical protein
MDPLLVALILRVGVAVALTVTAVAVARHFARQRT